MPHSHSPTTAQPQANFADAPLLMGTSRYDPNPNVRNIMITGGAGFIASWVARHLTKTYTDHYKIVVFDKLDYCASMNNINNLDNEPNFAFYKGDIMNAEETLNCLKTHKIDTIMHFAAQSHVDLSFGNSYDFTRTNVYGTHVLLECARACKIKKFIHVSTDEVYGEVNDDDDDLVEESLLAPTNPYAATKAAAEMLVNAYYKSFRQPVIIVRSNNVYGPHQYPEKVIPKFSLLLQQGSKLPLHGSGTNTRRYLYAGDAADAFDAILHLGTIGSVYNVGSYDEISNIRVCGMLMERFGLPAATEQDINAWVVHTQDRPFNDHRYAVDGSKLRELGWVQKTPFDKGLDITVDWYRKYGRHWWGDIQSRLAPFPEEPVQNEVQRPRRESLSMIPKERPTSKGGLDWAIGTAQAV